MAIVFFANITFAHSVDFHICQGELQSIALFGQKATCGNMVEVQVTTQRSCCDVKQTSELSFRQKSCCDNVQITQDQVFANASIDIEHADFPILDLSTDFFPVSFQLTTLDSEIQNVEIPPPPNIRDQHSPENLQVFII